MFLVAAVQDPADLGGVITNPIVGLTDHDYKQGTNWDANG